MGVTGILYPQTNHYDALWNEIAIGRFHLQMTKDIVFDTLKLFNEQQQLAEQTNFEQNFKRVDILI